MTLLQRLITGQPNGTTATTANTGASSGPTLSAGSTATWATAKGAHSQTGLQLVGKPGGNCLLRYAMNGASNQMQLTTKFTTPLVNPSAAAAILAVRTASGRAFGILWANTGSVILYPATGSNVTIVSAGTLSLNTQYVMEIVATGASTSTSSVTIKFYAVGGSQVGSTATITGQDFSINNFTTVELGGVTPAISADHELGFVDLQMNDGAGSAIPDYVPVNAAPTVDAGANQNVSAASTVNLSATANDADGSIASYAWTFDFPSSGAPSLTGGSTATPSFTSGSAGALYILKCTVTDNLGSTANDTVEIRVPVAGAATARHIVADGTGTGTWTKGGGSATDGAALNDETDTTYVESPALSGTEVSRRIRIAPSASKATAQFKERLWTDTGTATATLRLYEGNTLRQSWTQGLTTTATEYTFSVSSPTIAAISDWSNLYLELGVVTP